MNANRIMVHTTAQMTSQCQNAGICWGGAGGSANKRRRAAANKVPASASYEVDWFSDHADLWAQHVAPNVPRDGCALLVRPHEGRAAQWLLENVLTDRRARLTCIDRYSDYGNCMHFRDAAIPTSAKRLRAAFQRNILSSGAFSASVELVEGEPWAEMSRIALTPQRFDLVAVDHTLHAPDTLELATLALRLVKPGGIIVLTNYTHSREHDQRCPRLGIDVFLTAFAHQVRVLQTAWHTFVQRRASPLPIPPCLSEQFEPHPPIKPCPHPHHSEGGGGCVSSQSTQFAKSCKKRLSV